MAQAGHLSGTLRSMLLGTVLAGVCAPAAALDPLTLILLRLVRDQIISRTIETAVDHASSLPRSPVVAQPRDPVFPLGMDDTQLRRLIDEGFIHLSVNQRDEVFSALRRILLDPRNAADAPGILADLAVKASAVRRAHEALSNLSDARKRTIALEAREAYEKLPAENREELVSMLRARVIPLPVDLNDMLLAEFSQIQSHIPAPPVLKP